MNCKHKLYKYIIEGNLDAINIPETAGANSLLSLPSYIYRSKVMKNYGIIYKATNIITGKSYIGQTTRTLKKRWHGHLTYVKKKMGLMIIFIIVSVYMV